MKTLTREAVKQRVAERPTTATETLADGCQIRFRLIGADEAIQHSTDMSEIPFTELSGGRVKYDDPKKLLDVRRKLLLVCVLDGVSDELLYDEELVKQLDLDEVNEQYRLARKALGWAVEEDTESVIAELEGQLAKLRDQHAKEKAEAKN